MFKGLFDVQSRLSKIDRNGDPLKQLNELIDWEMFRPDLGQLREKVDVSKGGRPPIAPVLKFKMLILQSLYNLSDDALEQQVLDRLSFMRFLGLGMGDDIPDAKTIWAFRERLKEHGLTEKLFARFGEHLNRSGFDASPARTTRSSSKAKRFRSGATTPGRKRTPTPNGLKKTARSLLATRITSLRMWGTS